MLAHFVPIEKIILTYVSSGPLKIQELIWLCKILDSQMKEHIFAYLVPALLI